MFYGDFSGERSAQFREAIALMRAIFGGVYAADNLITFSRSAGFLEDADFRAAMAQHALSDQEKITLLARSYLAVGGTTGPSCGG